MIRELRVGLGDRAYPILIGSGLLARVGAHLKPVVAGRKVLVVTNPTVRELYGGAVGESLAAAGFDVAWAEMPEGERYKTLTTVNALYDRAFASGLDREAAIVALGGGVVGDTAGFAAATFMRGIHFIQIPTTLLAQVDASVGGKVGVNHPRGKNVIGAFYQPRLVLADVRTLRSLPHREVRAGLAEVIKYGVIRDEGFFGWLEADLERVLALDDGALAQVVEVCCRIKAAVVEEDEREGARGVRQLLNYGHTIGHALETLTGYAMYLHGEAVAVGMVAAAKISRLLGRLPHRDYARIRQLILRTGLPVEMPAGLDPEELTEAVAHDKKVRGEKVNFILPEKIGAASVYPATPDEIIGYFTNAGKESP